MPGALPFKPSGAGEREGLGLPPAQDRRDPGALGAGPGGARTGKRGSVLGRHRKWLAKAGNEMRAQRRGRERKERAAAGRRVRLGQFSAALRKAILHGEGDLEALWPALAAAEGGESTSGAGAGAGAPWGSAPPSSAAYEDLPS